MEFKVTIKTIDGLEFPIFVNHENTIGDLKNKIAELLNISPSIQTLIFNRQLLENERTLDKYEIDENSVLFLAVKEKRLRIFIHYKHSTIVLEDVRPSDTVNALKHMVEEKAKISTKNQKLTLDGKQLQDGKKLSEHNIQNDSTVVVMIEKGKIKISIQKNNVSNKVMQLEVYPEDTIKTIKEAIAQEWKAPVEDVILSFQGVQLENCFSLSYYDIESGDTIINSNVIKKIQIFVRAITGDTYTVQVNSNDTIGRMRDKYCKQLPDPLDGSRFVFGGRELKKCQTLEYYDIGDGSTINEIARMKGGTSFTLDNVAPLSTLSVCVQNFAPGLL